MAPDKFARDGAGGLRGGRAPADGRAAAAVARDGAAADDEAPSRASSTPDDVVKLNVGGERFEASRAVLTKVEDSMLGRMFGRCDAMLQPDPEDRSIFIDRDGEWFGLLLDFLRGDPPDRPRMQRAMRALPEAAQQALVQELDYFGLVSAVFGALPWTDGAAFRLGSAMRAGRSHCAAVSVDGHVVVFSGRMDEFSLKSTLLLDAQTMAFTAGPNLVARRDGCAAVRIDADRVLVVGGGGLNTTEMLHLSTLTFTPGPNMQSARYCCAAVALDARRILVVGGGRDTSRRSEILSLDTMSFAPGPSTAAPRHGCAAVALDEHRVMVAGGHAGSGPLDTTEILDIRTMAFAPGPYMSSARYLCAAVPVDSQHVLIIGGEGSASTPCATTELLDLGVMEFSPGPAMRAARSACAAVRLEFAEGPEILVIGGEGLLTTYADDFDKTVSLWGTEVLALEDD